MEIKTDVFKFIVLLFMAFINGCVSNKMENNMISINSADFQGVVISAPNEVYLSEITQGKFIWDRSDEPSEIIYIGKLPVKGMVQIFVPQGKQQEIWDELDKKIHFFIKDTNTGEILESSPVAGGWDMARQGISISGFTTTRPDFDAEEYYATMPGNRIDKRDFNIELSDIFYRMPKPEAALEIYAEYRGYSSNKVFVKALLLIE